MTGLVKRGSAYVISLMAKIVWISVHFFNRGRGYGALDARMRALGGVGSRGGVGGGGVGARS